MGIKFRKRPALPWKQEGHFRYTTYVDLDTDTDPDGYWLMDSDEDDDVTK